MSNMKLWEMVCDTPPNQITIDTSKTPARRSVKASIQKENATKVFGIYGKDWGPVVGSENYLRSQIGDTHLLHYTAVMFYIFDGERGEFPIAASIKEAYVTSNGKGYLKIDEEAVKKVRTDALTKGLSELGFNADIFKGYHDQQGYCEYISSVIEEKETEKAEQDTIKQAEEYSEWKAKELDTYQFYKTIKAVTTAHTGHVRKASKIGDTKGVKQFTEAKDKRIEEIQNA